MLRSMTGVGRAQAVLKSSGGKLTVDIRSVNHKYFELVAKLPPRFAPYESEIHELVRRKLHRGSIQLQVTLDELALPPVIALDQQLVREYLRLARKLKKKHHLAGELNINTLFTLPGVITTKKPNANSSRFWLASRRVFVQALRRLVKMRQEEGAALARDLRKRITKIRQAVRSIESRVPKRLAERRENLLEQLRSLNIKAKPRQVLEEMAFITEKVDIHEECVRLKSHCSMFSRALRGAVVSGKKLDFIAQEMLRETDTLAAKARDVVISRRAIDIKGEIEKLKEQVRNVE